MDQVSTEGVSKAGMIPSRSEDALEGASSERTPEEIAHRVLEVRTALHERRQRQDVAEGLRRRSIGARLRRLGDAVADGVDAAMRAISTIAHENV